MIDALVLAGSMNDGPLRECSTVQYEALIPIGQRPMVDYVVDALLESKAIRRVVVVGPLELQPLLEPKGVQVILPRNTMMENLAAGFEQMSGAKRILVVTSDIPLITPESIDRFIELCAEGQADLYFPVVKKEAVEEKFPRVKRTYVKLKEGTFTGGNIFLVNPQVLPECYDLGQQFIDLRKSPLGLCKLLGPGFLIKFISCKLTVAEAEKKVSALLGIKGQAVICGIPEVGVDVDKPSDLSLVIKTLGIKN